MPYRADSDQLRPTTKSGEMAMAYPNLRQAIWLLVLFILIQAVLALLLVIVDRWQLEDEFVLGLLLLANFIVFLLYLYRRTDLVPIDF